MKADVLNGLLLTIFFTCLFVLKGGQAKEQSGESGKAGGGWQVEKSIGGFMCRADVDGVTRKGCTEQVSFVPCHL